MRHGLPALLLRQDVAARSGEAESFLDQIRSKAFGGDGDKADRVLIGLNLGQADAA